MIIYEIATGYTSVPATIGAATELVVEELSRAFLKKGLQVQLIDIPAKRRTEDLPVRQIPMPQTLCGTDVTLGLRHKAKRVVYSLRLAAELKKLLRETREETVLHFHNQYNLFFFLLLTSEKIRKKSFIAYTVHTGIWRQPWGAIRKTALRRYFQEICCMRKADGVFVLNKETAQTAAQRLGVERARITVLGNGVNPARYYPLELPRQKLVLQVGSVCENKGQLRALQLLLPCLQEEPQLTYAYAGAIVEPAYQEKILAFVRQNGLDDRVTYLGTVTPGQTLNGWYNRAAVSVFPSRYEAFGLAAVESLAAGTPVLVARESGLDFGDGCLLYDGEDFSELLQNALGDAAEPLRRQARANAVCSYSWDSVAQTYLQVWKDRLNA